MTEEQTPISEDLLPDLRTALRRVSAWPDPGDRADGTRAPVSLELTQRCRDLADKEQLTLGDLSDLIGFMVNGSEASGEIVAAFQEFYWRCGGKAEPSMLVEPFGSREASAQITVGQTDLFTPKNPGDYDSAPETMKHIHRVRDFLNDLAVRILERGKFHDATKLGPHEKPLFDEATPKLRSLTYGTEEYRASLRAIAPALEHHYANNSHHPEFYGDRGITGMDLIDLIEMVADWRAASERGASADVPNTMLTSLGVSAGRFRIGSQLHAILENTIIRMGWASADPKVNGWNDTVAHSILEASEKHMVERINALATTIGLDDSLPLPNEDTIRDLRHQLRVLVEEVNPATVEPSDTSDV